MDVVDLFSYFCGPFFLHAASWPYFLVDVISVDVFSVDLFSVDLFPNTSKSDDSEKK